MGERPVAAVRDEGCARAGVAAGFDVVKIVADHEHVGRHNLPSFANLPNPVWVGFGRPILAGNDWIKAKAAATEYRFGTASRVACQQRFANRTTLEPFEKLDHAGE